MSEAEGLPVRQWLDQVIERQAIDAISHRSISRPRWGWAIPRSYHGLSGEERIAGWQLLHVACRLGLMPWANVCSICACARHVQHHSENYFRPLFVQPICRSCHYRLHRRFIDPDPWTAKVAHADPTCWAIRIAPRELTRDDMLAAARLSEPFVPPVY